MYSAPCVRGWLTTEPSGLMDRWKIPTLTSATFGTVVKDSVLQVRWESLQPTAWGPINMSAPTYSGNDVLSGKTLSQELADSITAGSTRRFRIIGGVYAPQWVKDLEAFDLVWDDSTIPTGSTCLWFWRQSAIDAYAFLHAQLIFAGFDDNPFIGDIVMSGGMTVFSEPMLRQLSSSIVKDSLVSTQGNGNSIGYTPERDLAAMYAYMDVHDMWKHTTSSLACNAAQSLTGPTSTTTLTSRSKLMIDYFRAKLNRRAAFGNHSCKDNQQAAGQGGDLVTYTTDLVLDLYPYIKSLGSPFYIQTDAVSRLGRIASSAPTTLTTVNGVFGGPALDQALYFGASSVELPIGYNTGTAVTAFTDVPQAAAYDAALRLKPRWLG